MEQKKFEAVLVLLVPQIIHLISEHHNCSEISATKQFYSSHIYEQLEKEDTKLWHLSAQALYSLFNEEITTGSVTFPEEA